jgi:anti-sigma-K factor RskA
MMGQPGSERLEELAVDEALGLLTSEERAELAQLLRQSPGFDSAGIERAVAAVIAARLAPGLEPLPTDLAQRVHADAAGYFAGTSPAAVDATASPLAVSAPPRRSTLRRAANWSGWALAAGLAAALLLTPGLRRAAGPEPVSALSVTPEGRRLEAVRSRLLASEGKVFVQAFAPGPDATGTAMKGDVVWDDRSQQGYMRLSGLRANDPSREQYQLWIFDAERDQRYPVDGGVFDIRGDGSNIVRIRATVPVHHAVLFAITVEKPGGVVVSTRERVAGLAKPG